MLAAVAGGKNSGLAIDLCIDQPAFTSMRVLRSSFLWRWPGCLAVIVVLTTNLFADNDEPVAVFTQVFNGYHRTRQSDQSFKPETYVFGEGGYLDRPGSDPSLKKMTFLHVAHAVAAPLARLNYQPSFKPEDTQLLILVFWGSTQGSGDYDPSRSKDQLASASAAYEALRLKTSMTPPAVTLGSPTSPGGYNPDGNVEAARAQLDFALWQVTLQNASRDRIDDRNARILGYETALERARFIPHMMAGSDVLTEIGRNRYVVALQAYDFRTAAKDKKMKALWTARISIDEAGNDFRSALDHMLTAAAPFLGQDGGLRRNVVREGRIEVGPAKVVEEVPKK